MLIYLFKRLFLLSIFCLIINLYIINDSHTDESLIAEEYIQYLFKELSAICEEITDVNKHSNQHLIQYYFKHFDSQFISNFVLGNARKKATHEQQIEFEQLFPYFLFQFFLPQLNHYCSDKINIISSKSMKQDTIVFTELKGQNQIKINFRLRVKKQQWQVLDLEIAGVSMLLTQRDVIASILKKHQYNFPTFLDEMRQISDSEAQT